MNELTTTHPTEENQFTLPIVYCPFIAAARVGEGGKKQLWYHTFVSSYFGLSRTGIKTNAAGGLVVALSYFDERLALMRSQLDDKLK